MVLHGQTRGKLLRQSKRCKDADARRRYLIVVRASEGWSGAKIAHALGCCEATVSRTLERYRQWGDAGLIDRREDNGDRKVSEEYAQTVQWILASSPPDFFHRRPTWTQSLLIETAAQYTGITLSRRTMGRLLADLKVRRGRPKPTAPCPWSKVRKNRRLTLLKALVETLPANQACVWEDEADIELNPRIGLDYMLPGTQRTVLTPGKNVKRYLAGAMDAQTDRVMWVRGERKNSSLFIELMKKLLGQYADKKLIHVILDNYIIHCSRQTQAWLAEHGQKIRLHFLPPYCPDDNRIERKVWREMHANVTVNHRCQGIEELLREVVYYLMKHNRRTLRVNLSELRPAI